MPAILEHSSALTLQRERDRSFQEVAVNLLPAAPAAPAGDFWHRATSLLSTRETLGIIGEAPGEHDTEADQPHLGRRPAPSRSTPVSALLELGIGFHPDLTGRRTFTQRLDPGLGRRDPSKIADIIEFSELERFIDVPVKHYRACPCARALPSPSTSTRTSCRPTRSWQGDESFQRKAGKDRRAAEQRQDDPLSPTV
jgi:hypothetical protein